MDIIFHYPPELINLLIDTIPLLCRSKKDTILFFKGAGVDYQLYADLQNQINIDPKSINKYEIVRNILSRLNEKGEATLRERREILKRVTEFEEFSTCWPNDQLKAKGLVAEIRKVIDVKDSFTRMKVEWEKERKKRTTEYEDTIQRQKRKKKEIDTAKKELYSLFNMNIPQERGKALEKVLNNLFNVFGILVKESFILVDEEGKGISEQVDGVVEIDGEIYLVEMKWTKDPIDRDSVSTHLVRTYHRGCSRAIYISASEYTVPAIQICKEALQKTVIILCTLEEIVMILEREGNLLDLLKRKISIAITEKNPFKRQ